MLFIAQGIAGAGVLQSYRRRDIARVAAFDILTVVRVHLQDSADTLIVVLVGVVHRGTGVDGTGIHTEEAQLAHKGVGHNLERQSGERLVVGGVADHFFFGFRVNTLNRRYIRRGGHIIHDRIQQLLYALVAVGSTAGDRNHSVSDTGFADGALDLVNSELLAAQIFLQQLVILLSHVLDQLSVVFFRQLLHVVRNFFHLHVGAHFVIINISLHFHQVDDTLKGILRADRQLNRNGIALQTVLHHLDDPIEIGAHDIHLIDIGHSRHVIFVSLAPYGFRLRLHAALGAQNCYRAIQYSQRALHLYGKVNVAGGVDDVDTMFLPEAGSSGGGNGDTSLLLLRHPVHGSSTVVGFADLMVYARIVQNTFRCCCFTGIDVSHDADITGFLK